MLHGLLQLNPTQEQLPQGLEPSSSFEHPRLRLLFYGTLYNRDLLQTSPDDSRSDAALAAESFLQEGRTGFARLDGSFTLIYYTDEQCGIVRDHHGTHLPVYYTKGGIFASALDPPRKPYFYPYEPNSIALASFLQSGLMPSEETAWDEVFRLEAGTILYKDANEDLHVQLLFPPDHEPTTQADKHPDIDACARQYGALHEAAIRRRIAGCSRVGILLSGGYDSGSNLAALRKVYDGEIESYSIGFKGDTWTELPLARLMSKTFHTTHYEYEIDGSEISALPAIIHFLGEPFVEGGLMVNYCAMRLVAEHKPQIVLGGDGSDQYFGTTGREVAMHYLAARYGLRPWMRAAYHLLNRERFDKDGTAYRLRFHLDKLLHILEADRFGFPDFRMKQLLRKPDDDFLPIPVPKPDVRSFEHLYAQHRMVSDIGISINRVILYKASRMAEMFGNRLTYPYMDLTLYHFLQQLPVGLKCKGDSPAAIAKGHGTAKYLLKYHYKPLLPEAITAKKKQGGFAPMPLFFRDDKQRARLKEFILHSGVNADILNRRGVERFLATYDREASQENSWFWYRQNHALQYFNLLALAVWWEQHIELRPVDLS
ncbi:MAG: asparagine synthase [Prevotellaceae bacterium]|jgi:asparagine synthetase B (glutamine-hydrolysing)|nr:asparagine synthase [Prevotellaceae bacterium]